METNETVIDGQEKKFFSPNIQERTSDSDDIQLRDRSIHASRNNKPIVYTSKIILLSSSIFENNSIYSIY